MTLDETFNAAKAGDLTNDTTYKVGEISRKTGLQKQPDGSWAPPKSGAKPAAKQEAATGQAKTYSFQKAGHVYKVPASSPAEAVEKLASKGVKGFKESDAFDDSTSRSQAEGSKQETDWDSDMPGRTHKTAGDFQATIVKNGTGYMLQVRNTKTGEVKAAAENKDPEELKKMGSDKLEELTAASSGEKKRLINVPGQTAAENLQQWENSAKTEARILGENQVLLQNSMGDVVFYSEGDDEKIDQVEARGYKKMSLVRPDGSVKRHQTNNPAASKPSESNLGRAHNEKISLDQRLKKLSMPAMAATLGAMDFKSSGVKQVNGTTMETFKKEYGDIVTVVATWQKGNRTGSAVKMFNKGQEETPTGVLHNMNMHGVIWSKGPISDAAPRQLTGDCKIRLTNDTTYKVGEISRKTGLQKQPDGSWAPPKQTRYGKVTTNKNGEVGIQQTLGKGSKFEKFGSEKEAARALGNYTAGYNTTERSKEDPHSNEALLHKHWDKEVEKIRKENKAERRAAHAAQFMNKPEQEPSAASSEENSVMVHAKAMADNEQKKQAEGQAYLEQSVSGYSDQSLKQAASTYSRNLEEFDEDIKSFLRRDLAPAQIAKRINSANFAKGALKAINAEIEVRSKKNNPASSEEKTQLENVPGQSTSGNYEAILSRANPAQREVIETLEEEMQMVTEEDLGKTQFRLLNRAYNDFQNSGDISKLKNVADILERATGRNYHTEVLSDGEATDGEYTAESVNAPRENLERKLTGDCKIRIRK